MKHPRPVSLTPPAISTRTFAFVRKGYNPKEVRAYLAELESAIVQWTEAVDQPQLSPTEATIEGERILQAAQQQADALVQDAAARAVVIADDPASFFTGDRWEEVGEHAAGAPAGRAPGAEHRQDGRGPGHRRPGGCRR